MARLFQALMLIAGLLWSGVCVAQCRVLPQQAKAQKKKLPPCHQQQQQTPDDCKDESCSVPFADAEKSIDNGFVAFDLVVGSESIFFAAVSLQSVRTFAPDVLTRPTNSVSILRI